MINLDGNSTHAEGCKCGDEDFHQQSITHLDVSTLRSAVAALKGGSVQAKSLAMSVQLIADKLERMGLAQ